AGRQTLLYGEKSGVVRSAPQRALPGEEPDDPALEGMQPAIERKIPVAFEANEGRQILRALKLAKELKLEPIVTGGRHAEEVAADLKAQNVRVVYSLNYPVRPRTL